MPAKLAFQKHLFNRKQLEFIVVTLLQNFVSVVQSQTACDGQVGAAMTTHQALSKLYAKLTDQWTLPEPLSKALQGFSAVVVMEEVNHFHGEHIEKLAAQFASAVIDTLNKKNQTTPFKRKPPRSRKRKETAP